MKAANIILSQCRTWYLHLSLLVPKGWFGGNLAKLIHCSVAIFMSLLLTVWGFSVASQFSHTRHSKLLLEWTSPKNLWQFLCVSRVHTDKFKIFSIVDISVQHTPELDRSTFSNPLTGCSQQNEVGIVLIGHQERGRWGGCTKSFWNPLPSTCPFYPMSTCRAMAFCMFLKPEISASPSKGFLIIKNWEWRGGCRNQSRNYVTQTLYATAHCYGNR